MWKNLTAEEKEQIRNLIKNIKNAERIKEIKLYRKKLDRIIKKAELRIGKDEQAATASY